MKNILIYIILILTMCPFAGFAFESKSGFSAGVRPPAVAGRFYPADPFRLTRAINAYLEDAVKPAGDKPIAIISPHAGYIFSGQICADAFKQAAGFDYDLVVLLGTNHTAPGFLGVSIYPENGYQTPLGTAKIDETVAHALIAAGKEFTFKKSMHVREHSIEVQVPFVQTLFPDARIVAAIIGTPDIELCTRFGKILAKILQGKRALIVASSDLSHYPDYKDAVRVDRRTLEAIIKIDPSIFQATLQKQMGNGAPNLSTCACGEASILTAMVAAKALGAAGARIVSYANSGDVPIGDHHRVVGYGAVSFSANPLLNQGKPVKNLSPGNKDNVLNQHHKIALLSFARKTIRQLLTADTAPLARGFDSVLYRKQGAFVTLKKHGELRGCIGHMAEDLPLCQVVGAMSLQAAFNDRRFTNLTRKELPEIEIEISVLTPFQQINEAEDILIGRDGVVIRKNGRAAVFLPQVAVEQGWDRNQMLDRLCRKAGLPEGSWKKDARLFTFQAIVFSESEFR